MPLFEQQKIDDPAKWRAHYAFGGALLLGFAMEAPGRLSIVMTATKSGAHPALVGLGDVAKSVLPKEAFVATVRVSCSGVRGLDWIGRPGSLSDLKESTGAYGRVETFEVAKLAIPEKDLWPGVPQPFVAADKPLDLWHGRLASRDFAIQWFCEAASLREGA
ncbi:MAG: hypothetical protein FD180_1757 [Planctomycetota bacterium]|nr:MAG: hypothetical protein FD180_1757 [Planctomycetota bacterium]